MSRITKSVVERMFNTVCWEHDLPTSAEESGKHLKYSHGYVMLDYYSLPDNPYKWKLVFKSIHNGGEFDLHNNRLKSNEMYYFLLGLNSNIVESVERVNVRASRIERRVK